MKKIFQHSQCSTGQGRQDQKLSNNRHYKNWRTLVDQTWTNFLLGNWNNIVQTGNQLQNGLRKDLEIFVPLKYNIAPKKKRL